ncbi:MAG: hypothetical protein ACP5KA_00465 [Desulfurococcaceae archaeon]
MGELALFKVTVGITGFSGYLYTSKLVKTLLIKSIPELSKHFEPVKGPVPKLLHITPLYVFNRETGKVKCIYSYIECKSKNIIKCREEVASARPTRVELNGVYYFYVGVHSSIIDESKIIAGLQEMPKCIDFMGQRTCFELYEIEYQDPHLAASEAASRVLSSNGLKVVFSSPAMLRDPLRPRRRVKTFLPTPINVFATPVYAMLYAKGKYARKNLMGQLLRLHRFFNETYSALGGLRVRWVYYSKKPEPALVGYVNYRIDEEYRDHLSSRISVQDWLREVFAYTMTLGVGAGRAAGFGHVLLKPLHAGSI